MSDTKKSARNDIIDFFLTKKQNTADFQVAPNHKQRAVNFEMLYLRAQMELEGVLGL